MVSSGAEVIQDFYWRASGGRGTQESRRSYRETNGDAPRMCSLMHLETFRGTRGSTKETTEAWASEWFETIKCVTAKE